MDLIYLIRKRGYRMVTVPIVWNDRRGSRMHPRPGLALRVAWDLLRIRFIHRGVRRLASEGAPAEDAPAGGSPAGKSPAEDAPAK